MKAQASSFEKHLRILFYFPANKFNRDDKRQSPLVITHLP